MDVRGYRAGAVVAALLVLCLPAGFALAQPAPRATATPDPNAAIVRPLVEIGRVRSRTPYCAALATARAGIDSAISYEYGLPIVAAELRGFRVDSRLNKENSLKPARRDISALYDLALRGRTEIAALRATANAVGVDPERRREMIAFANALDGAKGRQILLAKKLSRIVGGLEEVPVRTIIDGPVGDERAPFSFGGGGTMNTVRVDPTPTTVTYTQTQADGLAESQRTQELFATFFDERMIKVDLKDAAQHAIAAMDLGGCSTL